MPERSVPFATGVLALIAAFSARSDNARRAAAPSMLQLWNVPITGSATILTATFVRP